MAARAALILSGAGCVLPSVSSGVAVLAECVRHCGFGGDIAFEVHLSSRLYRRVCLRFTPVLAALLPRLPLVHACPRGSIAAFAFGSRLPSRFYRRVCLWFTPALAVLSPRLPLVHACLFSFVRKKETACGVLRFYSAGRDRLRAFSQCRCSYLPLWVHFGFGCFFMAISTGYRGAEDGDTGSAARPLCVFAQAHWPCYAFRREYVGAARPRLRQRVFDSLDSPQGLAE